MLALDQVGVRALDELTLAVELDALQPQVLQALVREAIEANLDLDRLARERDIEERERQRVAVIRTQVGQLLEGLR